MKTIVADTANIAFCGLYCGACPRFLKEKCPGCRQNEFEFTLKSFLVQSKKLLPGKQFCQLCRV